ncbi:chorismate-binding protein [Curtobacterium flaccumfaciens]|nr:chorismate-binding protein [Curtobacterium flaccumfaciens]
MATSPKDRAENVMIVDLLRNDLLRTAVPGSVHVERLCEVETYASVHQLVSTIGAVLPPGASRADVVHAAFPPGSMTGAPKRSATAIADRLEGAPRGVYSGAIGYFSASGAVDLSVAIRSLVTVLDASGAVCSRTLGAGGAVTWSSVAADEADEVETKTRSVLGAVGAAVGW